MMPAEIIINMLNLFRNDVISTERISDGTENGQVIFQMLFLNELPDVSKMNGPRSCIG